MSSILDALERADQERRRDQPTPARALSGHTRSSWKPRGFWILVGSLLLANLVVWTLVWRSGTPVEPGIRQAERESANPPSRLSATPVPVSVQEAENRGAVPSLPPASIEAELKRRARPGSRPLLAEARVSPPSPSAQPSPVPPVAASASAPERRVSQAADAESVRTPSIAAPEPVIHSPAPTLLQPDGGVVLEQPESLESAPAPATAATPVAEPSEWERVPSIWEVPRTVRARLEGLKVSVHLYHSEPGRRFVIIDKHRYREEDSLENKGLKLKRITPEGIIIDYGDGEVRM